MIAYPVNHPYVIRNFTNIYLIFGKKPKGIEVARLAYEQRKAEIRRKQGVLL